MVNKYTKPNQVAGKMKRRWLTAANGIMHFDNKFRMTQVIGDIV